MGLPQILGCTKYNPDMTFIDQALGTDIKHNYDKNVNYATSMLVVAC